MAIDSRALVFLGLACSMMVVALSQSNTCCEDTTDSFISNGNTLTYKKNLDGTVDIEGGVTVGYTSPRCGSCAFASYNLKPNACTYGSSSLPTIRSFKCTYYLTSVSSGFTDKKETRRKQPCYYSTDISKRVNETHYEQCSVSYIGVGSFEFSLSGPSSVATANCQGLVALPNKFCSINRSFFP